MVEKCWEGDALCVHFLSPWAAACRSTIEGFSLSSSAVCHLQNKGLCRCYIHQEMAKKSQNTETDTIKEVLGKKILMVISHVEPTRVFFWVAKAQSNL